jgi:competence protein ComEA
MPFAIAAGAVGIAAVATFFRAPAAPPATRMQVGELARRPTDAKVERAIGAVVVYVVGEVKHPGVYRLEGGARIERALAAASGPTAKADLLAVNLAAPLTDGEQVFVPAKGTSASVAAQLAQSAALSSESSISATTAKQKRPSRTHHRRGRAHKAPPAQPIDLNLADVSALEELPGIGPSLAERIVTYRDLNGRFRSADELLDVAGMTDRRLDAISAYIVVR